MVRTDLARGADVVVIGAGLAGYRAALEAATCGAEVLLLEKQPGPGGSTALSSGFLAFAGTDIQRAAGVEDDDQRLLNDLRAAGGGYSDEALLNTYVENQLATYRWLRSIGTVFKPLQLSSAQSVPRTHPIDIQALLKQLAELCTQTGKVRTLLATPATRLGRDPVSGRVTAVNILLNGASQCIAARRGVVLAAGGFSHNEEMLANFVPHQARGVRFGGAGNTGDGIKMAWALGAGLRDMGLIKGTFGFHPDSRTHPGRDWTKLPVYQGAIAVNKYGTRFVDESRSYKLLGDAVLQQPDAVAYQIFDQDIMDKGADNVPPFDFQSALRRGLVIKADTLAKLATQIGLESDILESTVQRYNEFVASGCDADFGRDGLATHYGTLVPISRAPYYGYASTSGLIATYCGLTVSPETQVIDVYRNIIEGLYAAGELMGGFHGESYMTGSALGKCLIFGRIAGRNAAQASGQ